MAERTCFNCVYSCCDPLLWLRWLGEGEEIVPQCANHPQWPGRLHDVPGVPCRNYRPKPVPPQGDNVRMIPLTDGGYAYVDAADYDWLHQWRWHLCSGYAARSEKGKLIFMHHQILPPPPGRLIDHVDGNKTNDCRCNLRPCTRAQNNRNKRKRASSASRFKCVFYDKRTGKWYARCRYKGKNRVLGYFDAEVEAARAYDRKAVEWFGEFARLNFPQEWPPERRAAVYAQRQEPPEERAKVRMWEGKKGKGSERVPKRDRSRLGSQYRLQAAPDHGRAKGRGKKAKTKSAKPRRARRARRGEKTGEEHR